MPKSKFTVGQTVYLKYENRLLKPVKITAVGRKYVTIGRDRFEIDQGIQVDFGFSLERDSCGMSRGVVYLEESHYAAIVAEQQAQDTLRQLLYSMRYGNRTRAELLELRAAIDTLLNLLPDPSAVLQPKE